MEIVINDGRALREIQSEFSKEFPYLKLEFFQKTHIKREPSPKLRLYSADRKVGTCRKLHNEGTVTIVRNKTVAALEQELWDHFGLSAQVFRKSGNLWIETTLTDLWTLDRQNKEGKEFSSPMLSDKE
jgi:hypothetical protein